MQTPSVSPKSLRQSSQLARGALLGRGDLPHPRGVVVRRGLPCTPGSLQQCHAAAGGVWKDPGSFSLGKTLILCKETGGSGFGAGFARRTGCHCRLCIPVCEGETRAHPDSWIQKGKRT